MITAEADVPFDVSGLLAGALARRGLDGGGVAAFCASGAGTGEDFIEPLTILVESLEVDARLSTVGRWITHRFLARLLDVRLQIADHVRNDPGVREERIAEPIIVIGAPRTGTTIMHALLAADPRSRVPLGWELLRPVPPPLAGVVDGRLLLADQELRLPQSVTSDLSSIHAYGGAMHKECLSAMSLAFRGEEFVSRYSTHGYIEWLSSCDMTPAYEMHRLVLQILQRRQPTHRWVLKSPVHLHNLDALLATYPDARLVVTHRDPLAILGSVTSLIATLRSAHSDHVSRSEIGRYHAELYLGDLEDLRVRHENGFFEGRPVAHVSFADLQDDPMEIVDPLYAALGVDLPDDVRRAIARECDMRARERQSGHEWRLEELHLDLAAERRRCAAYTTTFAVPEEIR